MKKVLLVVLAVVMVASLFVGCAKEALLPEVGMVTDAGTIDDKSFNQGTWEGVVDACKDFGYEAKYLKPAGTTDADYMTEITNLVDSGRKLIVCPGYKFEATLFAAQDKYPDVNFILIEFLSPLNLDKRKDAKHFFVQFSKFDRIMFDFKSFILQVNIA